MNTLSAVATFGNPLSPSRIAFYSTLAAVNVFVIGGIVFNFRSENNLRPGNKRDRQAFTYPVLLLVASETYALGVLYYGLDTSDFGLWTTTLTTIGTTAFFSFFTARIVDPTGNAFDKPTGAAGRRTGFFTALFVLAIVIPEVVVLALNR